MVFVLFYKPPLSDVIYVIFEVFRIPAVIVPDHDPSACPSPLSPLRDISGPSLTLNTEAAPAVEQLPVLSGPPQPVRSAESVCS